MDVNEMNRQAINSITEELLDIDERIRQVKDRYDRSAFDKQKSDDSLFRLYEHRDFIAGYLENL